KVSSPSSGQRAMYSDAFSEWRGPRIATRALLNRVEEMRTLSGKFSSRRDSRASSNRSAPFCSVHGISFSRTNSRIGVVLPEYSSMASLAKYGIFVRIRRRATTQKHQRLASDIPNFMLLSVGDRYRVAGPEYALLAFHSDSALPALHEINL